MHYTLQNLQYHKERTIPCIRIVFNWLLFSSFLNARVRSSSYPLYLPVKKLKQLNKRDTTFNPELKMKYITRALIDMEWRSLKLTVYETIHNKKPHDENHHCQNILSKQLSTLWFVSLHLLIFKSKNKNKKSLWYSIKIIRNQTQKKILKVKFTSAIGLLSLSIILDLQAEFLVVQLSML